MHINLSGHHVAITDGIREAVENKFAKIGNHFPQVDSLNIILRVERNVQSLDVTAQYLGATLAVQAAEQDMYAAIASAAKKLEAALTHRKGSIKARPHVKPQPDADLISAE